MSKEFLWLSIPLMAVVQSLTSHYIARCLSHQGNFFFLRNMSFESCEIWGFYTADVNDVFLDLGAVWAGW
jgi:hypothetical protein